MVSRIYLSLLVAEACSNLSKHSGTRHVSSGVEGGITVTSTPILDKGVDRGNCDAVIRLIGIDQS